jgi:alpha-N-acetylglucosamine transferase
MMNEKHQIRLTVPLPRLRRRVLSVALLLLLSFPLVAYLYSQGHSSLSITLVGHGVGRETGLPGFAPHISIRPVSHSSRLAIAMFLDIERDFPSTECDGPDYDIYYVAARVLTYQLLHAPATKIRRTNVDWLILAPEGVEEWKVAQLRRDGARVHVLETLPAPSWVDMLDDRWANQFTKLLLYRFLDYDRILCLDGDMVLQAPLDSIFYDEPSIVSPSRTDYSRKPSPCPPPEYVFAARPDYGFMGGLEHDVPPPPPPSEDAGGTDYFNSGFFVLAPAVDMFEYLLKLMSSAANAFNDGQFPEQDLLNWSFRLCDANPSLGRDSADASRRWAAAQWAAGTPPPPPMPWRAVNWTWTCTWCAEGDFDAGVAAMHEKW